MKDLLIDRETDIKYLGLDVTADRDWMSDPSLLIDPSNRLTIEADILNPDKVSGTWVLPKLLHATRFLFLARLLDPKAAPSAHLVFKDEFIRVNQDNQLVPAYLVGIYEKYLADEDLRRRNKEMTPYQLIPVTLGARYLYPDLRNLTQNTDEDFGDFDTVAKRYAQDLDLSHFRDLIWEDLYIKTFYPDRYKELTDWSDAYDYLLKFYLKSIKTSNVGRQYLPGTLAELRLLLSNDRAVIRPTLTEHQTFIKAWTQGLQKIGNWQGLLEWLVDIKVALADEIVINDDEFKLVINPDLNGQSDLTLPIQRSYQ